MTDDFDLVSMPWKDDFDALFDRMAARLAALHVDLGDAVADGFSLDELREDLHLTPTFKAEREVAQQELEAAAARFWHAAGVYDKAWPEWQSGWRDFVVGEFQPEWLRASQDLRAADVREQVTLARRRFVALRSRLDGMVAQLGDFS